MDHCSLEAKQLLTMDECLHLILQTIKPEEWGYLEHINCALGACIKRRCAFALQHAF